MSKVELQDLRIDKRYNSLKELSGNEFILIEKFVNQAKNGENNKGIDIKQATEAKYIDALAMAYRSWKKPLLELNKESLTQLKQDLKSGKIKSRFRKPYSQSSQREMELILIRFLEFAKPEKFSGMRRWFIAKVQKKDVDFLREAEIEKLYNHCRSVEDRFLVAVLFDSGARASEFLNIRFEDITEPTQNFPYYKINFKEEYSKTKGRNIGLYWKHSTESIKNYLNEVEGKPADPVFNKSYDAIRLFLTDFGKKILGKRIYFHIFRKSSATYYAQKLKSRQQLCYRYGWNFSSDVPDVYISREQGEEEVKENMKNTDMSELDKQNQELKTKMAIISEDNKKEIEDLNSKLEEVYKLLKKRKGFDDLVKEIVKK
ncbi:MAG: site-specific integrase [Nanoarchaeota archaeon]